MWAETGSLVKWPGAARKASLAGDSGSEGAMEMKIKSDDKERGLCDKCTHKPRIVVCTVSKYCRRSKT